MLFDPVDANDLGRAAMPKIAMPLLEIFADASGCNSNAAWSAFKTTNTSATTVLLNVIGSTHCDGENADRGILCGLVCGGAADPTRQKRYAHYATAFLLAFLKSDGAAASALCESALEADPAIEATSSHGVPGCVGGSSGNPDLSTTGSGGGADMSSGGGSGGAGSDGGGGVGGGGAGGGSGGSGGGSGGSDGGSGGSGGGSGGSGGTGCTFASGDTPSPFAAMLVLLVGGALLGRRRRAVIGPRAAAGLDCELKSSWV